ncbi:MAG: glycosyltransferase [Firmicutes bacterium]|nr:glycosyltransferase [Bacillota bacterium]
MKIVQVIPYFCYGGAETMCESLTYALKRMGHTVLVVSLYDRRTEISKRMEAAGVPIRYLDKKLGLDVSMVPKLVRIFREERPDVVHTHLDVIKYAVAAARLSGVKHCLHTVHNVAQEEAEGRAQVMINGFYFHRGWSEPVALSPEVQRTVKEVYSLDRIPVIYNGVDLSRCVPKERYSLGDTVTLMHIGRFDEQKNHAGLLLAFEKLLQIHPNCRLNLLGDGQLRKPMEDYVRELGIEHAVRFLGNQTDVHPYLHEADIFLLPSKFEGMPMTILEAMGTGLPIVASGVGGVPDMLRDGESGLLVRCDPEQVCAACAKLIDSEALREKLGRNALADSARFSADTMARQYCAEYERLMARK